MFEPSDKPRLFGVPPGADFPRVLVDKVLDAYASQSPEALSRVQILVNTRRMQRRLKRLFSEGSARLLPRIGLVTDVDTLLPGMDLPPPISRLRRKLELSQLTARLIEAEPDLAARAATLDLADSLAGLLDEMQGEGMDPERLINLDTGNVSEHWDRSLKFLRITHRYIETTRDMGLDDEARRRMGVEHLCDHWKIAPPETPVIIAGSTGSRATTRMLMSAVARLPQGALLLPGFDHDLPSDVWDRLSQDRSMEDHPQFRFAALLKILGITRADVTRWGKAPDVNRNALISLSLRPAEVTDQWLSEGPNLPDLTKSVSGLSLIEAPNPKDEARAVAIALRETVEHGKKVALITPDRMLARRVAAMLERWNIKPDDSAGVPLALTPPGRLLRQVARALGQPIRPDVLIALLKHPLARKAESLRGAHLRLTRKFELFLRARSVFVITRGTLDDFARKAGEDEQTWIAWLRGLLESLQFRPVNTLKAAIDHHVDVSERLASDPDALWKGSGGEACMAQINAFRREQDFAGPVTLADYVQLIEAVLDRESDRVPTAWPDVMIWGTLEARVQGADVVVLGGLNEGTWPEGGAADPWLNRAMRRDLGLLLPEGEVGLAAHDYQQAIAASEVILARAKRGDDGEAVPSRWLNRLTNLLSGLKEQDGPAALEAMKARGNRYLAFGKTLDRPLTEVTPAKRPAPAPPRSKRPRSLSVTEIARLIRDPYAIYARHVLGINALLPLLPQPDARLKGIVFHEVMKEFFSSDAEFSDATSATERLRGIAKTAFEKDVPWLSIRNHWMGQLDQIADHLISSEQARRIAGVPVATEVKGKVQIAPTFTIRGTADRIDRLKDGNLVIYDYKTGSVPSERQVREYDRQLLIEAVMAESGGFNDLDPAPVDRVAYIHLGRKPKDREIALVDGYETVTVSAELSRLLASFDEETTGYISRRAMEKVRYEGDYDHLARFGEWDASSETRPEPME